MKKTIITLLIYISISICDNVFATDIYEGTEFKVNLDNFNLIVDTEVLDDGSYNLLTYEREYLFDNGEESYKYTDQYYINKYNNNHELESSYLIKYDQPIYKIITLDNSKVLMTSNSDIILYNLNDNTYKRIYTDNLEQLDIRDIIPLNEGEDFYNGYLVVGKANGYYNMPYKSGGTGVIIKYNSNFELEWVNVINSTYLESIILNSIQINESEYIVSGKIRYCVEPLSVPCGVTEKGFIAKYNYSGKNIWTKEINVIPYTSTETSEGDIIVAGEKEKEAGKFSYVAGFMKIKQEDGEILWESEYKKDIKGYGFVVSDIVETNNELIATGQIESYNYYFYNLYKNRNHLQENVKEYFSEDRNTRPGFILKLSSDGNPISDLILEHNLYYDINLLNNDKILLTGDTLPNNIIQDDYRYKRAELYGIISVIDSSSINSKIYNVNYTLIIITTLFIASIIIFINNNKIKKS